MELSLPLVVDVNDFSFFQGLPASESLALSMLDNGVEVLVDGGFDKVNRVVPVWEISLRFVLREELVEVGLSHDVLVQVYHAELVLAVDLDGA